MDQAENKVEEKKVQEQPQQTQTAVQEQSVQQESDKDINWKKWKESRDKERKEAAEMAKKATEKEAEASALKAALEAIVNKQIPVQQQLYEEEESEEKRITKRVDTILAQREAEAERKRAEREHQEMPKKLGETFPDYNQVCSDENLDYIIYHYPEIAATFRQAPETFEKYVNIYKTVKRFVPNTETKKEVARADRNMQKPQSASKAGLSQGGTPAPSILSDDRKAQNWERMQKTMKGLS